MTRPSNEPLSGDAEPVLTLGEIDAEPVHARRRRRHEPTTMFLNVTAMIDVVFLLMTYFILLASFAPIEQSIRTSAPRQLQSSSAAAPRAPDPFDPPSVTISVSVRSLGAGPEQCAVITDAPAITSPTGVENLFTKARDARGPILAPTQKFIIRPELGTKWEHALAVLNALRRAGYDQVTFANPSTPAPARPTP